MRFLLNPKVCVLVFGVSTLLSLATLWIAYGFLASLCLLFVLASLASLLSLVYSNRKRILETQRFGQDGLIRMQRLHRWLELFEIRIFRDSERKNKASAAREQQLLDSITAVSLSVATLRSDFVQSSSRIEQQVREVVAPIGKMPEFYKESSRQLTLRIGKGFSNVADELQDLRGTLERTQAAHTRFANEIDRSTDAAESLAFAHEKDLATLEGTVSEVGSEVKALVLETQAASSLMGFRTWVNTLGVAGSVYSRAAFVSSTSDCILITEEIAKCVPSAIVFLGASEVCFHVASLECDVPVMVADESVAVLEILEEISFSKPSLGPISFHSPSLLIEALKQLPRGASLLLCGPQTENSTLSLSMENKARGVVLAEEWVREIRLGARFEAGSGASK